MSELGYLLIVVGILFDMFGTFGLIRLPDVYNRLQAATKCVTLGTCFILIGVALSGPSLGFGVRAILCAIFILLTSPVGAHALARASHLSGVKLWEKSVVDKYEEDAEKVREATGAPKAKQSD